MRWFKDNKRYWRAVFLILLVIAMIGPWAFDRISVPQPYTCSWPNVRLDDRFCGTPIPITWLLAEIPLQVVSLVTGPDSRYAAAGWFSVLVSLLLVFPFVSTFILLLRAQARYWSPIHRVALGLAGATGLLIGLTAFSRASWMLWGVWTYVFLTIGMCVLEARVVQHHEKRVDA